MMPSSSIAHPEDDASPWWVLVADDDEDVLAVTELALDGMEAHGRPVHLDLVRSAAEARQRLDERVYAAAILDVVMEKDDAGLELVRYMRSRPGHESTRIVIRTGQPGLAPEEMIIRNYDINDYWSKTELQAKRLRTVLVGLIRSFRDAENLKSQRDDILAIVASIEDMAQQGEQHRLLERLRATLRERLACPELAVGFVRMPQGPGTHDAELASEDAGEEFGTTLLTLDAQVSRAWQEPGHRAKAVEAIAKSADLGRLTVVDGMACMAQNFAQYGTMTLILSPWSEQPPWERTTAELLCRNALYLLSALQMGELKVAALRSLHQAQSMLRDHQRLEMSAQLTAGLAHDLNNLLTVNISALEYVLRLHEKAAQQGQPKPDWTEDLQEGLEAAQRASRLTRGLVRFGRAQGLSLEHLDASTVLRDAADLLTVALRQTAIALRVELSDVALPIEAVADMVHQALLNLAINARDAIGAEPGEIVLRSRREELTPEGSQAPQGTPPGSYAVMSLSDNGCGIPEEHRRRIFDAFYSTKSAEGRGAGLGLFMVRSILVQHGGFVTVQSEEGVGTQFDLWFPLEAR